TYDTGHPAFPYPPQRHRLRRSYRRVRRRERSTTLGAFVQHPQRHLTDEPVWNARRRRPRITRPLDWKERKDEEAARECQHQRRGLSCERLTTPAHVQQQRRQINDQIVRDV